MGIQTQFHTMSMEQAILAWDTFTNNNNDRSACRVLAQNDLFYLLVVVCKRHDLLHSWIYARCREVEVEPNGHLDLWAREHCKSSIITFGLTIQDILNNPNITIGIFSENHTLATKFLGQIKAEFETNDDLKKLFPDVLFTDPEKESPKWTLDDGIIVKRTSNPKEPTIEAQGLMSMKVGAHYDLMVYDDVITMNSISSPEMVEKITNYFEVSLSQSKEGGFKRFIGTRYGFADTYQTIIDREIATPRIYPATDNGKIDGKPVLFSDAYWETKKRENGTYNLNCQYLQAPNEGLEKIFNISKLEIYEVRPYKLNVVIVVDPAKSMKKGSADTAMMVIGIGGNRRKYLLDGFCHKMSLKDRWDNLKKLYQRWKTDPGVGILKVGYEVYGSGEVDLDYFKEQMKKENIGTFEIIPLTSPLSGSARKNDRIERIQPDLQSGSLFLPYPTVKEKLTKAQIASLRDGCSYRLSQSIRQINQNHAPYNLCDIFVTQLDNFPYGGLVDAIDCFSRVYDIEISAPSIKRSYALPENELT